MTEPTPALPSAPAPAEDAYLALVYSDDGPGVAEGAAHVERAFLPVADARAWSALRSGDVPTAMALWRESPGRALLLHGVDLLGRLHQGVTTPPFDLSPARIVAAASQDRGWQVPGRGFRPSDPPNASVETMLIEMALGGHVFARASAMAWLLDRVVRDPFYEASDGVRRDLRNILPPSLERVFFVRDDIDGEIRRASSELDASVLPHARLLARTTGDDARSLGDTWRLAAWLSQCLARSPLRTGDLSMLATRVAGVVPRADSPPVNDALDPGRFAMSTPDLVDLVEFAWLTALVWHLLDPGNTQTLMPPVARYLRHLAQRPTPPAEGKLEEALARGCNALGWSAPHIAPTVTARWLLTRARTPWLGDGDRGVFTEALTAMLEAPERYAWFASAVFLEGRALPTDWVHEARAAWRDTRAAEVPVHLRLSMAAGLLHEFGPSDGAKVVELLPRCEPAWRPFVIDALLDASGGTAEYLTNALFRALQALVDDTKIDRKTRLNAFMMALRRPPQDGEIAAWITRTGREAPFSESATIRREVNRLVHAGTRNVVG